MEPKLPVPHGSPEMGPPIVNPELPVQQGGEVQRAPEKLETHEQKVTGAADAAAPALPQIPVAPTTPSSVQAVQSSPVLQDAPAVAGDDDVIEKEWVEKAKKVIAETKHDPYLQEKAVSRLQADYLQKRYGKTVALPEEA